jgi:hypothetical protein
MRSLLMTLVALIIGSFSPALAQAAADTTPPSVNTGLAGTSLESANHDWSYDIFILGTGKQSGVGLGFHTPLLWDTVGVRVDYSFDRLGVPSGNPMSLSAIDAGLKIQLNQASSANLYTYLIQYFNFYLPRTGDTDGSTTGFETAYGIEWRHNARLWGNVESKEAAFIELGLGGSDLRATAARGGNSIGDGLIAKLGFRRFL